MYRYVEWLKPSDKPILSELTDHRWHTPKELSLNLDYTQNWIAIRLRELADYGFIERHTDDPAYRLSERGQRYLDEDISSDELQSFESLSEKTANKTDSDGQNDSESDR